MNLLFRFVLELVALGSVAVYGYRLSESGWRWILMIALPLAVAAVWGCFAVPEDPSRSGSAPIPVSGLVRLFVEALVFGLGAYAIHKNWPGLPLYIYLSSIVLHYAISYDRVLWLLHGR